MEEEDEALIKSVVFHVISCSSSSRPSSYFYC